MSIYNVGVPNYIQSPPPPRNVGVVQHAPFYASSYATVPYSNMPLGYGYPIQPQMPMSYSKLGIQKTHLGDDVHLYSLSNGQRVAILPKKEGSTIVKTFVNSGSMNENDSKRGISHFIEHNLFNGSEELAPGEFFKEVSKMGADTNASTDFAQTDYYIMSGFTTNKNLEKTIKMHGNMITKPLFPNDMIEKEKGPVTSEISMVNDSRSSLAANAVIKNLYQIKTGSDNLVAGSIKTVSALNKDDVQQYWRKHYTPDNMYTVLVGDVEPARAMELISKYFNHNNSPKTIRESEKLTPIASSVRVDFKSQKDNSGLVMAGFCGPLSNSTREKLAFDALGLLLLGSSTSRLSSVLQKINAQAGCDSQKVGLKPGDPEALVFQIITPKNKEQEGIDAMYQVIEDLKQNPPTDEEMLIVKNTLRKALAMSQESSEAICNLIGTSLLDGDLHSISEYQNIVNSLTGADIVNFAQRYLDLSKVSIAVVHATGTTDKEIIDNFERSPYSMRAIAAAQKSSNLNALNVPQGQPVSSDSPKPVTTNEVKELVLSDNNRVFLSNTVSDVCYFNWKLTTHSVAPKNLAVPYVLSAILNRATGKGADDAFLKNADLKAIDFNVESNSFSITANANSMPENALEAVNILKQSIFSPDFSEAEFEAAKQKSIKHFESLNKDPSGGLVAHLYPQYFADVPKILEGLKTVTLEDVKTHWANLLNNSSSNFVMCAPFAKNPSLENGVLNAIALNSGVYKNPKINEVKIYEPTQKTQVLVDTEERNQAQVFKTHSFEMSGNIEDEVKFELLNNILGASPSSRLFADLREKEKLAYRVVSQVQTFADTGILTMFILTTTDDKEQGDIKYDNVQKSLEGFRRHANKLQNELVSDEELESAKMALKQAIHKEFEMPQSRTGLLAMNAGRPYGIKRIDEYYKTIDKITAQDVQTAAKHVFSNKPVISVLASEDTINNQMPYLKSLAE